MGLGNTTDFATGRALSVALHYANGPFKAAVVYANEHDRAVSIATTGITTFQGVAAADYVADRIGRIGAGASYAFGKLLVHGLYTRVTLESAGHSDSYQSCDAGATYQLTPTHTLAGGAATTHLAGRRWTQFEIGHIYLLSKSTQLYLNALYQHANASARAAFFSAGVSGGRNQTIFTAGMHHAF